MSALASIGSRAMQKLDSWQNALTGLGGLRDKMSYFVFGRGIKLDDDTLENLYHADDMAARVCDVVPDEAMRQGFTLNTDDEDIVSKTHARCDELEVREKFNESWTWARVFGASAIFIGADDGQRMDQPLNENRIKTLAFLNVLDRRHLTAASYYDDPTEPNFGRPRTYRVQSLSSGISPTRMPINVEIHESRFIIFGGARTSKRRMTDNGGWPHSILQRVYEPLKQFNSHWLSVSHLMQDASQAVFKVDGLLDTIASGELKTMHTRMELVDMSRSVARALLLDADKESFERASTSFTGLADVLDKAMLRLSAAARIPATILMAQSPAGMDATGESDIRWFYDTIKAAQTNELKPRLERLLKLIFLSKDGPTGGLEPEEWNITFPPLWQMTPRETAELRKMIAETDKIYTDMQSVLPEEIATSRFRAEGYSTEYIVDLEMREAVLEAERSALKGGAAGEVPPRTSADVQALGAGGAGGEGPTDPEAVDPTTALNGAQVKSLMEIVAAIATEEMPRDTGVRLIAQSFPMSEADADRMLGSVGKTFFVDKPEPPAAFGAPPGKAPPPPAPGKKPPPDEKPADDEEEEA
jgi:uncharacterized protein